MEGFFLAIGLLPWKKTTNLYPQLGASQESGVRTSMISAASRTPTFQDPGCAGCNGQVGRREEGGKRTSPEKIHAGTHSHESMMFLMFIVAPL